jgi:hypothetical protein
MTTKELEHLLDKLNIHHMHKGEAPGLWRTETRLDKYTFMFSGDRLREKAMPHEHGANLTRVLIKSNCTKANMVQISIRP